MARKVCIVLPVFEFENSTESAILLCGIQTVTDGELHRNLEADVIDRHVNDPRFGFVEKGAKAGFP